MIARAAARAVLAICACAAASTRARADGERGDGPPPLRFQAAFAGGEMSRFEATADGRALADEAGDTTNGLGILGVDHDVLRWLALGVEARVGSWHTPWSKIVGYLNENERFLYDLDLVLSFRSPTVRALSWSLVIRLSPSLGLTWPGAPTRDTRAVQETWRPRSGGNVGIDLTVEAWHKLRRSRWQLGGAVGVTYTRHWFSLDGTFTPVSEPAAAVSARYDYVTDMFLFKLAFLAGF